MWFLRFLRLFFALFLSQVILFFLFLSGLAGLLASRHPTPVVESGSVLWIPLAGEIIEYPTLPNIPFLRREALSQNAILTSLEDAATDADIDAVLLEFDLPDLGWGKANELHEAILRFRESGKSIWALGPMLEEVDMFVASACDSIFMPPTGNLFLNGIGLGSMYFKGAFDKLDVHANYSRTGAYKSGPEPMLRDDMSIEDREQNEWLLDEIWTGFMETVASSRGIEGEAFALALDEAALSAAEAVQQDLVDGVRHRAELLARFADKDGIPRVIEVMDYHAHKEHTRKTGGEAIAVIHARGLILRGQNGYNPNVGPILGASSVIDDLEDAVVDDDVRAIVLRIDSGGGEIVASDMIRDAVFRARQKKPVVVSMVDVAASGGYMMAYGANRIVATPATLTGSIGSYIGKLNLKGLYNKLGITQDFVTRGRHPFLFSDYTDWSATEESLIARLQWADYDRWTADIAVQRGMTVEEVEAVARGRVWTGRQALNRGLVDMLGDLKRAVEVARSLADVPESASVRLVHYPRPRSWFELLFEDGELLVNALVEGMQRSQQLPENARWGLTNLHIRR